MISCCSKSVALWLNMNGPSLPTGCAAAAKPTSGAASWYPGPCLPMGTWWTRNARGTRAVYGSTPFKAAVVTHIFAWDTEPQTPSTLYGVAKRLSDAQLPTPMGTPRWHASSVRGILCHAVYTGIAHSGKSRPVPARQRQSALRPVGPGVSHRPTPPEDWTPIPVPAIISPALFDAAQARLERNSRTARRNNTVYTYLLRGLVSCGQCQLACTGRTSQSGSSYYWCRGRTDPLRAALGERCMARYIRAQALDT